MNDSLKIILIGLGLAAALFGLYYNFFVYLPLGFEMHQVDLLGTGPISPEQFNAAVNHVFLSHIGTKPNSLLWFSLDRDIENILVDNQQNPPPEPYLKSMIETVDSYTPRSSARDMEYLAKDYAEMYVDYQNPEYEQRAADDFNIVLKLTPNEGHSLFDLYCIYTLAGDHQKSTETRSIIEANWGVGKSLRLVNGAYVENETDPLPPPGAPCSII